MSEAVRVAVRVRPFIHEYEKAKGIRNIIRMDKSTQQTFIKHPETGVEKTFTFDFSYNSFVPEDDPNHASQETVWQDLGIDVLENAWKGFNVSLFAYGQTGAGKSHSMMGYPGAEGIVPRACREIFERIDRNDDSSTTFKVEASMLEIYNEKIRDLFNPSSGNGRGLKVRDHPKKGPYVQNLTKMAVSSYDAIANAMDAGTKARTVAATAMNANSSRAHTIFQVIVTQTTVDQDAGKAMDKVSIISLIDLAGSERADRTGASGDRLKEGCAINQSLSALGNVISALADKATNSAKRNIVIPYRDSVLTHLLKNSLGGNAKTIMIAAISPSCVNYDETVGTLRYADRAKQIKNKAVVNEDPNQKLIRGLKEEIEQLRAMLANGGAGAAGARPATADVRRIKEEMSENERLLEESEKSWEDRLKASQNHVASNNAALEKLGMGVDESKLETTPHLLNLNQDSQMSGVLTYFFEQGITRIGRKDAENLQNIVLSGLSIQKEHSIVSRIEKNVSIQVCGDAKTFINGKQVQEGENVDLSTGDRLIFGNNHVFLYVFPDPNEDWKKRKSELLASHSWEEAMHELNESQISHLTEGERKAREKAEQEAKEMQNKVKALEKKIQEERDKALREARIATDVEKEKMLQKQKEMEEQLQKQIDNETRKQAQKETERRKRAVLDQQILQTLPLISEANAISDELEKEMVFEIQLVATASSSFENADQSNIIDEEAIASSMETSVWIRVQSADSDIPNMWDYEKFVNRLYLMREMYEDFVDSDRNMEQLEEIYGQEYDPFYDPVEEQLIGKAYIMLAPLGFFINIEDVPPVIQYQGKTDGALEVAISLNDTQIEEFENYDIEEETTLKDIIGKSLEIQVAVKAAKGLPKRMSSKVAVSYKFFTLNRRTPACLERTINPRFDHVDKFSILVTEEFVNYIAKEPLEFQVWGSPVPIKSGSPSKGSSPTSAALSSSAANAVGGTRSIGGDEIASNTSNSVPTENKNEDTGGENDDDDDDDDDADDNGGGGDGDGDRNSTESSKSKGKKKSNKKKKKKKHRVKIVDSVEEQQRLQELEKASVEYMEKTKDLEQKLDCTSSELVKYKGQSELFSREKLDLEKQVEMLRKALTEKEDNIKDLEAKTALLEGTIKLKNDDDGGKASSKTCTVS